MAEVFPPRGRGRLQVIQGVGWLTGCQGNQERSPPHLINYHSKDTSDLKIRTISSCGQGQVCRHLLIRLYDEEGSARWGEYRRHRDWSSRGCTESKRTAILSGLVIQECTSLQIFRKWLSKKKKTKNSEACKFGRILLLGIILYEEPWICTQILAGFYKIVKNEKDITFNILEGNLRCHFQGLWRTLFLYLSTEKNSARGKVIDRKRLTRLGHLRFTSGWVRNAMPCPENLAGYSFIIRAEKGRRPSLSFLSRHHSYIISSSSRLSSFPVPTWSS